ncbi:unnamed protein product [Caenorhabditis auriculariae]|uniref:Uncharacterized protein n=1 Tax=Caenorhabditis auriculariae TaxID=2777116 RepID=A0A8S1H9D5_9PELO|nr:unnamed protein product [Caenorhabditis auriculariae]
MESFVIVRGNQRVVEVTAEIDGIIRKKTLRAAFQLEEDVPIGLFRNNRGLKEDDFFELQDGWNGAEYELRWEEERRSRVARPADQAFAERPMSPYYPSLPPDPAPTPEAFSKWMFYLHDHLGQATAICVHPRYFVSFRHGSHLQLKLGETLKMYTADKEVDEQVGMHVSVVKVNEELDFILLKSEFNVVERGPSIARAQESEPFTLAGFGNEHGRLSYLPGTIHSVRDTYFEGDGKQLGPFILGTSPSSRGDSGGGIWGSRGLIGSNFGCTTMPLQYHHLAISEAATHLSGISI